MGTQVNSGSAWGSIVGLGVDKIFQIKCIPKSEWKTTQQAFEHSGKLWLNDCQKDFRANCIFDSIHLEIYLRKQVLIELPPKVSASQDNVQFVCVD